MESHSNWSNQRGYEDTYVGVGKDELANLGVESVSIDALAGGQDQSGAGTIGAVSGGDHFGARAKDI